MNGFPEIALQHICDYSWRSEGKRPDLFDLIAYLPLIASVLVGGYLGSLMESSKFSSRTMGKCLGAIIVVAIVFLTKKISSSLIVY